MQNSLVTFIQRTLAIFLITFGLSSTIAAQPTIIIPHEVVDTSESFCIELSVMDFTDIINMQFSLAWDPDVLQFNSIQNLNLQYLDIADFNTTLATNGMLTLNWFVPGEEEVDCVGEGLTIEDETAIFELCFTAIGDYGTFSEITIVEEPLPVFVTRVNACPIDIGLMQEEGFISIGVDPVLITGSTETGNAGDLVCVNMSVSNFTEINYMQFAITWNPGVI
ncbi:MAG: hypothetical protein GY705_24515, partial [Bacteroidetes bacterium]|nr:hypothetical protein [Bacteroidota bacterium]